MGILDPVVIQRETFGAKLRRLARSAEISNPLINPPWTIPAAWVTGTAYVQGNVVSTSGGWYVAVTSATSGATAPTSTTTGDTINDGGVLWTYIGGPAVSASDAMAPTFASTTSNPFGNAYTAQGQPNVFRVYGGYAANGSGSQWAPKTFNQAAATPVAVQPRISFLTDSTKPYIILGSSSPAVRFVIDNRYYAPGCFKAGAGTTWASFDFASVGGRRVRRFTVEGFKNGDLNFGGVNVGATEQVWAPPADDDVRAAFIADSLFAGSTYGPMLAGANAPCQVSKLLGWSDPWTFSTGSTGYIATASGTAYAYGDRIAEALTRNPDVWVFMGSTNDIGQSSAAITAAALAAFRAIRNGGSTSPIIVLGVWSLNNAGVSATEAAVQAAVTQFADPAGKTFFIPIYADPVLPWVTGAWNNTNNTGSVNATMYIAGDNTHPADIGTSYLSRRIVGAIRTSVLPFLK